MLLVSVPLCSLFFRVVLGRHFDSVGARTGVTWTFYLDIRVNFQEF